MVQRTTTEVDLFVHFSRAYSFMSFARALISPRERISLRQARPVFYRGPFASQFARCPIRGGEASIYGQVSSGAVLRLAASIRGQHTLPRRPCLY